MRITPCDENPFGDEAEEPKPQFKGVWIPASIWESPLLTWTEKCLLAEIDCLSRKGNCFASNAYLALKMGMTEGSIANALSKLVKGKFILHMGFRGRKRQILVAQNVQSDPQLHIKVKVGSFKSEGTLHQEVNIENRVEKKMRTKITARRGRAREKSSCPSVEAAIEHLEAIGFRAFSQVEACAEKWFAAYGTVPLHAWREHLAKFADKFEADYLSTNVQ